MAYSVKIGELITKFNAMTSKLKANSGSNVDVTSINNSIAAINNTLFNPETGVVKTINELDAFLANVSAANPNNVNLVEVINAVKGRVEVIEAEISSIGTVVSETVGN